MYTYLLNMYWNHDYSWVLRITYLHQCSLFMWSILLSRLWLCCRGSLVKWSSEICNEQLMCWNGCWELLELRICEYSMNQILQRSSMCIYTCNSINYWDLRCLFRLCNFCEFLGKSCHSIAATCSGLGFNDSNAFIVCIKTLWKFCVVVGPGPSCNQSLRMVTQK